MHQHHASESRLRTPKTRIVCPFARKDAGFARVPEARITPAGRAVADARYSAIGSALARPVAPETAHPPCQPRSRGRGRQRVDRSGRRQLHHEENDRSPRNRNDKPVRTAAERWLMTHASDISNENLQQLCRFLMILSLSHRSVGELVGYDKPMRIRAARCPVFRLDRSNIICVQRPFGWSSKTRSAAGLWSTPWGSRSPSRSATRSRSRRGGCKTLNSVVHISDHHTADDALPASS
jgi:hypothetical protein